MAAFGNGGSGGEDKEGSRHATVVRDFSRSRTSSRACATSSRHSETQTSSPKIVLISGAVYVVRRGELREVVRN